MAAFATRLNQANEFTESRTFAGGVALIGADGPFHAQYGGPVKVIVQSNHTGNWEDLGDAHLQQDEGQKTVYIPAGQVRFRRSGTDSTQDIEAHFTPST